MRRHWLNLLSIVVVIGMLLPVGSAAAAPQSPAAAPTRVAAKPVAAPPSGQPATVSPEEALNKIHPKLRAIAQTAGPDTSDGTTPAALSLLRVMVTAQPGTDLSAYMTGIIPTNVLFEGEQDFYGSVAPTVLLKIASLASVIGIIPVTLEKDGPSPLPPEELATKPTPTDLEALRARAAETRGKDIPWDQGKAIGDGYTGLGLQDFYEVAPAGPHKAEAAWARGYDGTGVVVAVNDDGVDWAHPDLMGRQTIYSTTITGNTAICGPKGCAAAYNGWPMAYSPFSLLLYVYDVNDGTRYIAGGQYPAHYADTSATPQLASCGMGAPNTRCFLYRPLITTTRAITHTYTISATLTKSGVVHVGSHPDENLRDYVWGEKVAVLVTDPHVAGVYDTVYVDLDDDYDFRDEKPLTRANPADPTTYNNMIAYRDLDGDGKADLSGGALYFIADGVTPLPHAWVVYVAAAAPAPGNGDLVAFDGPWSTGYSHGTQCASNVVGQGVVNGMVPAFGDLPGDGKPAGAVYGAAKNARLVDVSNIYWDFDNSKLRAYTFAVYGYDGLRSTLASGDVNPNDSDGIQITSNSYGTSSQDNDSWEYDGRYVSRRQRLYGRYLSMLFSTGNGAPAYGTVAPPSPDTAIAIGASTQYGSTGWDSITYTTQIQFNDVTPFSNRGPSARGTAGVDVVANGAYAAGDEALNYYSKGKWGRPDGNRSWDSWGGTSRSAPAAMGNLALIYQAFRQKHGRWPWWDEARAIFKSSAADLNYDVFTQGAGSVDADRGTAVAGGLYGIYVMPDEWNPGGYRGADYPAFAHVMTTTQTEAETFTIQNTGSHTVTAQITTGNLKLISSQTFNYSITPAMYAAKSADNFYKAPQWVIPITATQSKIAANSWWSNIAVPQGTQMMLVTMRYPYSQYDANGDYNWDNRFRLMVYNWKDVNGNGKVWDDKNSNGVVNFTSVPNITQIDGGAELDWANPATEIDRWEYERFSYNRPGGNVLQMWVHDPLTRMQDGLFVGLTQYAASSVQQTNFTFLVQFFTYEDVPWLSASANAVSVAPGSSATFAVTAQTRNTRAGIYEAAIKVLDPGGSPAGSEYPQHVSVVPVVMTVVPDFSEGMTFGGAAQAAEQAGELYNNAVVRGYVEWTWRAESGDWRFFFLDNKTTPPAGTKLIVKNEWADAAPHTDLDTIIMGPTPDSFSPGGTYADPAYYGPYTLDMLGRSPNMNVSAGIWRFNTASGGAEEWVTAPFANGLHAVALHNVLFEGDKFDVVFTTTVGTINAQPSAIHLYTSANSGSVQVVVRGGVALPGVVADAYGLGGPESYSWLVPFTGAGSIERTQEFNVAHAAKIEITTSSPDISDIDIYLQVWNGQKWVQVASSAGGTAAEHILYPMPADGRYRLAIDNFSGPAGTVNAVIMVVQGTDLKVTGTTTNNIPAGTPVTLTVSFNRPMFYGNTYQGTLLLGPTRAPSALEVPVFIHSVAVATLYLPLVSKRY